MIVMTPVTVDGRTDSRFGRAHFAAIAEVADGALTRWEVHEVDWDGLHDASTHGSHHARVITFLREQGVEAVVAPHMGEGMARMLTSARLPVLPASPGDAKASVLAAVNDPGREAWKPIPTIQLH
jgi:predicted Fe-Mo cluster-binding NifX family protein